MGWFKGYSGNSGVILYAKMFPRIIQRWRNKFCSDRAELSLGHVMRIFHWNCLTELPFQNFLHVPRFVIAPLINICSYREKNIENFFICCKYCFDRFHWPFPWLSGTMILWNCFSIIYHRLISENWGHQTNIVILKQLSSSKAEFRSSKKSSIIDF